MVMFDSVIFPILAVKLLVAVVDSAADERIFNDFAINKKKKIHSSLIICIINIR